MPRVRRLIAYVQVISARSNAHRGSLVAGGLAFFVALSVAPAALAIGWLVGRFLSPDQVREALTRAAQSTPGLGAQVQPVIDSLASLVESASSSAVTITSVVGVLVAVFAASRTVIGLRLALNSAFGSPDRYRGILERVSATVITLIGLVAGVAAILALTFLPRILSALGLTDVRITTGSWLSDWLIAGVVVWIACWFVIARGANHRTTVPLWSPGPILAAAWIVAVSIGVGAYASLSSTMSAAVAIFGSALVILLWLYLGFIGLLLGAEVEAERQGLGRVAGPAAGDRPGGAPLNA